MCAFLGCGSQIPLQQLFGWQPSMEVPDLLHNLYLGTGRDCSGSLLCDLAMHAPWAMEYETWDEKLRAVTLDAREWCRANKLAPSSIDDFSH